MNWFAAALKKYATFSGRSRRKEYWYFFLCYVLLSILLAAFDVMLGVHDEKSGVGLLSGTFALATLLPAIAVGARRLHDIGRTGWWLLIGLVPLIGGIILFIFAVRDGDSGPNAYGPDPKAVA